MIERVHAEENIKVLIFPSSLVLMLSHWNFHSLEFSLKAFHVSDWRGEIFRTGIFLTENLYRSTEDEK